MLGASLITDKMPNNLMRGFDFLMNAMRLRYEKRDEIIAKENVNYRVKAYDNWIECKTIAELNNIRFDRCAMYMEALSIRERILGRRHPDLVQCITYCGEHLAQLGQFEKCIALWNYAMKIRLQHGVNGIII